ncbi:MAG: hypothetical protein HXL22_06030, partial [Peptostreptococcus sp.]|nr:hypothetical protein [Peptostreptococcus sp.]
MLKETEELLLSKYGIDKKIFDLSKEVDQEIKVQFDRIKEIREYNQLKVLNAMQEANLSDNH